jgi:hypothetical protein
MRECVNDRVFCVGKISLSWPERLYCVCENRAEELIRSSLGAGDFVLSVYGCR